MKINKNIERGEWDSIDTKVEVVEGTIPKSQQEMRISLIEDECVLFCNQRQWIAKLRNNPNFILRRATLNENGVVISISGLIDSEFLSFRKVSRKQK